MIGRTLCLAALILLISCAGKTARPLPELTTTADDKELPARCAALFPVGSWQFVHAISFHMADGRDGSAVGVVVLDDAEVRCALTTVEGLTLFEARQTAAGLEVERALPPFANQEFAAGMMRDISAIFRKPVGRAEPGRLGREAVCRYAADNQVTDVLPQADGCWSLAVYDGPSRSKTVETAFCRQIEGVPLPEKIVLVAAGPAGYTLNMQLLSAQRLSASQRIDP